MYRAYFNKLIIFSVLHFEKKKSPVSKRQWFRLGMHIAQFNWHASEKAIGNFSVWVQTEAYILDRDTYITI